MGVAAVAGLPLVVPTLHTHNLVTVGRDPEYPLRPQAVQLCVYNYSIGSLPTNEMKYIFACLNLDQSKEIRTSSHFIPKFKNKTFEIK